MNENVKVSCVCELGYDKGALKKTIENNVFTIYGNINKNNYIVLRYHGELIDSVTYENYQNNLYISYFFDSNQSTKKTIPLAKCTKCIGENYCILIYLEEHNNISFEFFLSPLENTNKDDIKCDSQNMKFNIEIRKDPLTDVLEKYGFEENTKLPLVEQESGMLIKKIICNIKNLLLSLFRKKDTV